MADEPAIMMYASIISREMVALNDLAVSASDIQNAYLTPPCEEKIWTTLGLEFGVYLSKKAIITCALYGLKSSGGSFNQHILWTACKH